MTKAGRRYIRTLLLAVMAMAALLWAAVDLFEIPPEEIMALFLATAVGAAGIIAAAATVVFFWIGVRKLIAKYRD